MPTLAMRAASRPHQANKSAQSDQQDLIGEMETNRRQEPARGKEVLRGEDVQRNKRSVQQRSDKCLARLSERLGNGVIRGANKQTLYALALLMPLMMVLGFAFFVMRVPLARRAAIIARLGRMPRIAGLRAIVGMMRAAPHHEVNHQNRGTQTMNQFGHANPHFLAPKRHRQTNSTILNQSRHTICEACAPPSNYSTVALSRRGYLCGLRSADSAVWRLSDNRFPSIAAAAA